MSRGAGPPRFARHVLLLLFAGAGAVLTALAVVVILIFEPAAPQPPCRPGQACSNPPRPEPPTSEPPPRQAPSGHAAPARPYLAGRRWTSRAGPSIRYTKDWHVVHRDAGELQLLTKTDGDRVWVTVRAAPASEASPFDLLQSQVQREQRDKLGFKPDPNADDVLLEPSIGFVRAFPFQASFFGTLDVPPSPSVGVECLLMAATNGNASVLVEAITDSGAQTADNGATSPFPVFVVADGLLTTLSWGSAAAG